MKIWDFATATCGATTTLNWEKIEAATEREAIVTWRSKGHPWPLEPYAGPLPCRCAMNNCKQQAAGRRNKFLPLCPEHLKAAEKCMPHYTQYTL